MSFELEKFSGSKSRYACPACQSKGVFARYKDGNGEYLSNDVGRCNRESKCGYHKKPKEFFAENPTGAKLQPKTKRKPQLFQNAAQTVTLEKVSQSSRSETFDYIVTEHLKATLCDYDRNAFASFLFNLFPDCTDEINAVLKMYFVGTYQNYTCFPSIDRLSRVCRAKLIRFNPESGKRLKGEFDTSSLPAKLKLKDFRYKQIFFGEHLLARFPGKKVAGVESEKTAIIASLCFPEFVWLGSNSKMWLKVERQQRLETRQMILYPDADGFELWRNIAAAA